MARTAAARAARKRAKHDRWIGELATAGYLVVDVALLRALTDPGECEFNHHGDCKAHNLDPAPCPHAVAKGVLAAHVCEEKP